MADREEAQAQANRIRNLQAALSNTEVASVLDLSSEQRERFAHWAAGHLAELERDFDVDLTPGQGSMSWGLRIASALGGVALSASLVLLFHRYWGDFDTWLQVLFVLAAPLAFLAAAEYAAKREHTGYFAGLLSLIALAAFILDLSVLGQAFNITPTERALLAWGIFALALAYRYGQRLLLIIGLLFLISYGCAAVIATLGFHWLDFGTRPEHALVIAILVWGVPLRLAHQRHPSFEPVYRAVGIIVFFVAVTALSEGSPVSYLPLVSETVRVLYAVLGIVVAASAIWLGIRRQWSGQANLGALFFCTLLISRFYHWWWDWMPAWLFFAIIGGFGVGVVIALKRLRRPA